MVHGFLSVVTSTVGEHRLPVLRLSSCSVQALKCPGSVVMAHEPYSVASVAVARGHSCSVASGIFSDQESTHSLHWQAASYPPFLPWSGNYDPTCFAAKKAKHETEAILKQT